jgi:pimeloyl-ACP methyl ester carboxylesterase
VPVVDLAVRESGAGEPLVLLHAFPLHAGLFDELAQRLPGYRVITPDLRGWGASPLGDSPPGLDVMADDVAACLDRLGLARAIVGGVSMGGYVTMELLRRHPDRLSGALLVDTKDEADASAARATRLAMVRAVLDGGPPVLGDILGGLLEGLLGATTRARRPDVVATVQGWLDAADPEAVVWAQQAMAARPASGDTLAATRVPLAVVVGEEDTLAPPDVARAMAQARPGTPVEVVPGCGHLAVVEDPDATAQAVLRVLGQLA